MVRSADAAVEGQGDARGVLDRPLVGHRQTPGCPRQIGHTWVFGGSPNVTVAAAEHLGAGPELHVDLQADDRLPGSRRRVMPRSPLRALPLRRPPPEAPRSAPEALLERMGRIQQALLARSAGPMIWKPTGRPAENPAGHADAGQGGQVHRDGAQVGQVHRQRVGDALADLEGHRGRRGRDEKVETLERPGRSPG